MDSDDLPKEPPRGVVVFGCLPGLALPLEALCKSDDALRLLEQRTSNGWPRGY
jgi:hypothetical protein